ncbi:MAG: YceD family protein, partial [Burkholderiaceae bacterium]
ARLQLVCQRCLEPVTAALDVQRSFRFVEGEAAAAELDAQCEDDVLALTRELDLHELLEDELLLCLPLVPKHEQCPQPLPEAAAGPGPDRANPFAALAALKRGVAKG